VLKTLKSNKGLTLVEMIIGIVMITIITGMVAAIFVPMLRIYARANEFAEYGSLLDTVANQMISDMSKATAEIDFDGDTLTIPIGTVTATYSLIPDDVDGFVDLWWNNGLLFNRSFYKNKRVAFELNDISTPDFTAYELTVILLPFDSDGDDADVLTHRTYTVKPLAIQN
jgi:type II secretory pathway pseudopilin PulG